MANSKTKRLSGKRRAKNRKPTAATPERGHAQAEVRTVLVEDPNFNRRHTEGVAGNRRMMAVQMNVRSDMAKEHFMRNAIDLPQSMAAEHLHTQWHLAGGSGAGALDYSAVKVDTSGNPDPISDRKMDAAREMKSLATIVDDERTWREMQSVYCLGVAANVLARSGGGRDRLMNRLRTGLSTIAKARGWG